MNYNSSNILNSNINFVIEQSNNLNIIKTIFNQLQFNNYNNVVESIYQKFIAKNFKKFFDIFQKNKHNKFAKKSIIIIKTIITIQFFLINYEINVRKNEKIQYYAC